ncbi:hypothetical protein BDZ45DRAFT_197031 [Acephala macrosclerotiorum]|nr:hypothetical protein BDZ45DRAFT_197031 [Acephala macrosclerotiorum]
MALRTIRYCALPPSQCLRVDQLMLDYRRGKYKFNIRDGTFDLYSVHERFEKSRTDPKVIAFREGQKKGVEHNLALEKKLYGEWVAEQEAEKAREAERVKEMIESEPSIAIDSPIDANVWKVLVEAGDVLKEGQVVAILEAMKMEINVLCTEDAVGATVEALRISRVLLSVLVRGLLLRR